MAAAAYKMISIPEAQDIILANTPQLEPITVGLADVLGAARGGRPRKPHSSSMPKAPSHTAGEGPPGMRMHGGGVWLCACRSRPGGGRERPRLAAAVPRLHQGSCQPAALLSNACMEVA
jgi:gephyrin